MGFLASTAGAGQEAWSEGYKSDDRKNNQESYGESECKGTGHRNRPDYEIFGRENANEVRDFMILGYSYISAHTVSA